MTLLCGVAAAPARAVTAISGSAFDVKVNLQLLGLLGVGIGPFSQSSGSGTAAFTDNDSFAGVSERLNLGVANIVGVQQRVDTGLLLTSASSSLPLQVGSARATVNDLSLRLGTVFLGNFTSLLSITSGEVISTSRVGANGGANASGFTSIAGLTISGAALGGLVINGAAFVNPDPNTVLLDVLGLRIILNEQTPIGTQSASSAGISTNAIRLIFDGFSIGGGLLSGDVIIAHSEAQINDAITSVPEPATWAQMILGFGLIGLVARRRKAVTA
ncbi:PEPxxWA-CTERM sorting domain-containing protein [Glacieibacterium frigidum]|uniref:PEPxxWA-CTERM sorting domain-containing protein n=1 Tax=Glacieibacterium frigidum TaxID=2593303 RepID=UPI00163D881E|nr:PEPxxWA-CTERM sorting domain-containing protein [Glacieibacterium frigidum]